MRGFTVLDKMYNRISNHLILTITKPKQGPILKMNMILTLGKKHQKKTAPVKLTFLFES